MIFQGNDYAPPDPLYTDEELADMKEAAGEEKYQQNKEDN